MSGFNTLNSACSNLLPCSDCSVALQDDKSAYMASDLCGTDTDKQLLGCNLYIHNAVQKDYKLGPDSTVIMNDPFEQSFQAGRRVCLDPLCDGAAQF